MLSTSANSTTPSLVANATLMSATSNTLCYIYCTISPLINSLALSISLPYYLSLKFNTALKATAITKLALTFIAGDILNLDY